MIRLSSHGAAKQVTGSCHLVETDRARVLVDCGLFQGGREIAEENAADFDFDPAGIDVLLLTHAHLDHCGRIPLLVRHGFHGRIVSTAPTRELAHLVLADAAGLQQEDARRAARHRRSRGDDSKATTPLYTTVDASVAMTRFDSDAVYGQPMTVAQGVRATFMNAGHILGSASILLELEDGRSTRTVYFSGDIGNPGRPLLDDPQAPPTPPDYVVMETTYGDRDHRGWDESIDELIAAVAATLARGGNVIIPTFALERAQEVLYGLAEGIARGRLPAHLAVFLDSPMAVSATEIFERHEDSLRKDFRSRLRMASPFDLPGLRMTRDASESMAINSIRGGAVIMAGSGMATGGRVRHHLLHNLGHADNAVIFVGFAAPGTLARQIIDGAKSVRLFDEIVPVRASIHTINGFSAHAGRSQLLRWLARCGQPRQVILVHGDPDRGMQAFADALEVEHRPWRIAGMGEAILLR
ncbi:MAG: Metallo-beta-lactamase family protein, RNA-specific [Burkholderiaceae bacterium]|jgi:metallo-beta-lactamase family protein|nr:MAG: Metallo-beta-lactamase family protein, RNA-specific [Burkholderiaceae bacterium]